MAASESKVSWLKSKQCKSPVRSVEGEARLWRETTTGAVRFVHLSERQVGLPLTPEPSDIYIYIYLFFCYARSGDRPGCNISPGFAEKGGCSRYPFGITWWSR